MARCNICRNLLSHKGGATTSLWKHLKARHPTCVPNKPTPKPSRKRTAESFESEAIELLHASSGSDPPRAVSAIEAIATAPIAVNRPRQTVLASFLNRPMSMDRQKQLNKLLLKMIVKDLQPFSVVEVDLKRLFPAWTRRMSCRREKRLASHFCHSFTTKFWKR